MSAFSPYSDSPTSPAPFRSPVHHRPLSNEYTSSLHPPPNQSPYTSSPSDIADPSPIATSSNASNGTDTTDIDDTGIENEDADPTPEPPKSTEPVLRLETKNAASDALRPRSDEDEQPSSVIHAPQGFEAFHRISPPAIRHSEPPPSTASDIVIVSPPEGENGGDKKFANSPISPPPIQTTIAPVRDWSATPRAQTWPEAEGKSSPPTQPEKLKQSRSSSRSSNLEDIPESQALDNGDELTAYHHTTLFDHTVERFQETADEVAALKIALSECWTLCNTLAGLSYIHRERIFSDERSFSFSAKGDVQEQAWKSCWKLCQKLYETRDEAVASQVRPTLDLCRDFCQCLFEVRRRDNDVADSVLRVSFELNNHLYNTHDRTLPEAFRERTLDFYITLCHRLMKQRSDLARETDSLLEACWSLAEMLFSLRQNKREGKPADEELLGSAVQACWELCDLFREGWTQIRPDRGTPRPSQTTFTQAFQQAKQSQMAATIANVPEAEDFDDDFGRANPETPTTVFEDMQQMSPDEGTVPNILVLGTSENSRQPGVQRQQWSSSSSTLSGSSSYSGQSASSASTSTIMNPASTIPHTEDPHLTCLKVLIVNAAITIGYQRSSSTTLAAFVKAIPSNSFGTQPWQLQLLASYKKLVASDPGFRSPGPVRRAAAAHVARSVIWMVGSHGQYAWLRDLYRLVFGFHVEEGQNREGVYIQN